MLALPLAEALAQVANGVITRKACDPQQGLQGHIRTQQTRVCEAPRSGHHRKRVPKVLATFSADVLIVTALPDLYFDEDVQDRPARFP